VPSAKPTIYLIAGCNGAGKTTFAKEFLPKEIKCLRFLNAGGAAAPSPHASCARSLFANLKEFGS
jgi:predicted ABC-type ATPase